MSVDDLFAKLEPPPGGAERFARRMERELSAASTTRPRRVALATAAVVVLVAVAILVVLARPPSSPEPSVAELQPVPNIYDAPAFDRLLGRPLQIAELTATIDQQPSTLTALESQNAKVRIYRIN